MANRRVHGTTYEKVLIRWNADQFAMAPGNGRLPYGYSDEDARKVARDAYVSWEASRYSVPWEYVGKQVWVRPRGEQIEVRCGAERIAVHTRARGKHELITEPVHHAGIPLGSDGAGGKILVHLREAAPVVESRPLAAYENLGMGGAQ